MTAHKPAKKAAVVKWRKAKGYGAVQNQINATYLGVFLSVSHSATSKYHARASSSKNSVSYRHAVYELDLRRVAKK